MMFTSRVLVVSNREEMVADLRGILAGEGHVVLGVATEEEAIQVFEDGSVPDILISDLGGGGAPKAHIDRFNDVNRAGRHLTVVRDADPASGPAGKGALVHPFAPEEVREVLRSAMLEVGHDLQRLRGEIFRETARLQSALRDAQLETVSAIALTVEARDPYMAGHCTRVATMARWVAAELGASRADVDRVGMAATLHELGKVSTPLELLHKTDPLTEEELRTIRSHAGVGAGILARIPSLANLSRIVAHQGTPHEELHLHIPAGTEDHLLAAVLRVVDAFDAMTSRRSYRETVPRADCRAKLEAGAGSLYHPGAVEALLRIEASGLVLEQ